MVLLPLQIVRTALEKAELLGTPFLPADFHPTVLLQVEFPTSGASVALGNELKPSDGAETPVITFVGDEMEKSTYTILSFDPDAPSRQDQQYGPWRHWIQGGLQPKSLEEISAKVEQSGEGALGGLVSVTKEAISPWVAPSPGKGTGPHRYCFALYRETKPLKSLEEQATVKSNERPDRRNFQVAKFAEENGLELVAFNYFLCENP